MSENQHIEEVQEQDVEAPEVQEPGVVEPVGVEDEAQEAQEATQEAAQEPEEQPVSNDHAERLHAALARLDGRLQDVTDLPFDENNLDEGAMTQAITELLERKPHLRKREVAGDIGAGNRGSARPDPIDLIKVIRGIS